MDVYMHSCVIANCLLTDEPGKVTRSVINVPDSVADPWCLWDANDYPKNPPNTMTDVDTGLTMSAVQWWNEFW
jgi:hypothetical protein